MLKFLTKEMNEAVVEKILYKSYGVMLEKCWEKIED